MSSVLGGAIGTLSANDISLSAVSGSVSSHEAPLDNIIERLRTVLRRLDGLDRTPPASSAGLNEMRAPAFLHDMTASSGRIQERVLNISSLVDDLDRLI